MWGLVQQGLRCEDCGFAAHKKCSEKTRMDCQPDLKWVLNVLSIFIRILFMCVSCDSFFYLFIDKVVYFPDFFQICETNVCGGFEHTLHGTSIRCASGSHKVSTSLICNMRGCERKYSISLTSERYD